jgi:hypothetical protein
MAVKERYSDYYSSSSLLSSSSSTSEEEEEVRNVDNVDDNNDEDHMNDNQIENDDFSVPIDYHGDDDDDEIDNNEANGDDDDENSSLQDEVDNSDDNDDEESMENDDEEHNVSVFDYVHTLWVQLFHHGRLNPPKSIPFVGPFDTISLRHKVKEVRNLTYDQIQVTTYMGDTIHVTDNLVIQAIMGTTMDTPIRIVIKPSMEEMEWMAHIHAFSLALIPEVAVIPNNDEIYGGMKSVPDISNTHNQYDVVITHKAKRFWDTTLLHSNDMRVLCTLSDPPFDRTLTTYLVRKLLMDMRREVVYKKKGCSVYVHMMPLVNGTIPVQVYPSNVPASELAPLQSTLAYFVFDLDENDNSDPTVSLLQVKAHVIFNVHKTSKIWEDFITGLEQQIIRYYPLPTIRAIVAAKKQYNQKNALSDAVLYRLHREFGSNPRRLFEMDATILESRSIQESDVKYLTLDKVREVFNNEAMMGVNKLYKQIHPMIGMDSCYPYTRPKLVFTSDVVEEWVAETYMSQLWSNMIENDPNGTRSSLFASYVRTLLRIRKTYRARLCHSDYTDDEYTKKRKTCHEYFGTLLGGFGIYCEKVEDMIVSVKGGRDGVVYYSDRAASDTSDASSSHDSTAGLAIANNVEDNTGQPFADMVYKEHNAYYMIKTILCEKHIVDLLAFDSMAKRLELRVDQRVVLVYAIHETWFDSFKTTLIGPLLSDYYTNSIHVMHVMIPQPEADNVDDHITD